MTNLTCLVQYDGTNFCGFQKQRDQRSVQGELEAALARVTQEDIQVISAGRTDAGVHAIAQVINFHTGTRLAEPELERALNAVLPEDVSVRYLRDVDDTFHARFSAKRRDYRYSILRSQTPAPLLRLYTYRCWGNLDVAAMNEASALLIGLHDFAAFGHNPADGNKRHAGEDDDPDEVRAPGNTFRVVYAARWEELEQMLWFDVAANGFLTGMVRSLVGTLLRVGRGELTVADFRAILESADRRQGGPNVPAHGLCLMNVSYDESDCRPQDG